MFFDKAGWEMPRASAALENERSLTIKASWRSRPTSIGVLNFLTSAFHNPG
jgi:hypothetical protein